MPTVPQMFVGAQELGLSTFELLSREDRERRLDDFGMNKLGVNPDDLTIRKLVSNPVLPETFVELFNCCGRLFVSFLATAIAKVTSKDINRAERNLHGIENPNHFTLTKNEVVELIHEVARSVDFPIRERELAILSAESVDYEANSASNLEELVAVVFCGS